METKSVLIHGVSKEMHSKVKVIAAMRGGSMQDIWLEIIQRGLESLEQA